MRPPLTPAQSDSVPPPEGDARRHTEACAAMLREAIDAAGGWLSFARFMELALYAPGLGYYAAGARKFGAAGDFVTAPEISPLFGQCLAATLAPVLAATGGDVLELGPGTGKLACDILAELDRLGTLPETYRLLEVSADLRERQQQAIAALPAYLAARAGWIDALPAAFTGVIIANEVVDVVPVHLVTCQAGEWRERGVTTDGDGFAWADRDLPAALAAHVGVIEREHLGGDPPEGYLTEISPAAAALTASLGAALARGAILLVDYGFRAAEYYHPSRRAGTLMCHYRHFAHPDPFRFPGLTDITAHVDFTRAAEAGLAEGLTLAGYTTQAHFLMASGLPALLARADPADAAAYLPLTNQVQRLTSPAEMGEFFKVLGFTRGEGVHLAAFDRARPLPL